MSVLLARHLTLQSISVEVLDGVNGQGLPSYDSPVDIDARVLRQDKMSVAGTGSDVKTQLTVYVPNTESVIPNEQDRITFEGSTYIVVEHKEVRLFSGVVSHTRLQCRDE